MKILFCKNAFSGPVSGADEIIATYAIELKKAGHSTSLLLVQPPLADDPLAARLHTSGVPIASLASTSFSTSLAVGRKVAIHLMNTFSPLGGLIRAQSRKLVFYLLQRYHHACCEYLIRHKPDVIHVVTPDPGAVMLIRAAHAVGIPVVYQEVGIPFHPPGFEEVYERFATVLPLCARVAALSPRLAQEMGRVFPYLEQPFVLPLISKQDTNGDMQQPPGETICFGFAGRLEHLKGPLRFLEAFAVARQIHPDINCKMAGEGSQHSLILASIQKLKMENDSQLVGVYASARERSLFMQSIDVFVLPSLTEGTPNALIEAMAHGRPVIATNVGGIADIVSKDVGILIEPEDTPALATAMARLAGDPRLRQAMGQTAQRKYEQLFTPHAVLPVLIDFYERSVDEERHSKNNGNGSIKLNHPWCHGSRQINAKGVVELDSMVSYPEFVQG
jgi:glycosyltransferase involved in cell wall biosynthesis